MNFYTILLILSTISFAAAYISTIFKFNNLYNKMLNFSISQDQIRISTEEETHKENYLKFVTESRDSAFKYIDDIQSALSKFFNEVDPQLEYYNKYGAAVEGMIPPHDFALKKISKEVEDLKIFLPLDYNKDKDKKWKK